MSMENAILDHAAALRELSAAIKEMYAGRAATLALPVEQGGAGAKAARGAYYDEMVAKGAVSAPRAHEASDEAKEKVRNAPRRDPANEQKPEAEPIKQDAEMEKAVSKVEDNAKKEKAGEKTSGATSQESTGDSFDNDALAAPLEYTRDVRPVLLQLSKAKGKDELLALLKKYGAKNGEAIKADDFAKIVADANALIGG